jgi:hypothetical protein
MAQDDPKLLGDSGEVGDSNPTVKSSLYLMKKLSLVSNIPYLAPRDS